MTATPHVPAGADSARWTACEQVAGLVRHPEGRLSPSVYETAQVMSLDRSLAGHDQRLAFVLAAQYPDGHWGPPHTGYALVPTLSAVHALLREPAGPQVSDALSRARRYLERSQVLSLPDLPAADLIVSSLVDVIGADAPHLLPSSLHRLAARNNARLNAVTADRRIDPARFGAKLLHALETVHDKLDTSRLTPAPNGSIGASPAATAAFLAGNGQSPSAAPARRYLEQVISRYNGPVPCVTPISVFETSWVLNWLLNTRLPITVSPRTRGLLREALGTQGAATSPGLPTDADTTSVILSTLAMLGEPVGCQMLDSYERDTHYCTWPGEQADSVTTNAHVLEALSLTGQRRRASLVGAWLMDQQSPQGYWTDRWHASPLYATFCAALALHRHARPDAAPRLEQTRRWLAEAQHPDGSWGIWGGSPEETAYALRLLDVLNDAPDEHQLVRARARTYLLTVPDTHPHPPLWHDKDLYAPTAIVQTAIVIALHGKTRDATYPPVG